MGDMIGEAMGLILKNRLEGDMKLVCVTAPFYGEGGTALAEEVVRLCEEENNFTQSYDLDLTIEEKLATICKNIYHADGVVLTDNAKKQAKQLTELGFGQYPICMAKTQYSFSDDPALLGAPTGFTVTVRNIQRKSEKN